MRRHDAFDAEPHQRAERDEVGPFDHGERPPVDGYLRMRIGADETVPGKVLSDRGHAVLAQASAERARKMRHGIRIAVQGAVADYRAMAVIEVQDRSETEIDPMCAELCRDP